MVSKRGAIPPRTLVSRNVRGRSARLPPTTGLAIANPVVGLSSQNPHSLIHSLVDISTPQGGALLPALLVMSDDIR